MGDNNQNQNQQTNRHEQFSPTQEASVNEMIQRAVQDSLAKTVAAAVTSAVQSLMPALKEMAITPDKLRESMKPWVDPAKAAREKRESQNSRDQLEEMHRNQMEARKRCPHQDKNGNDSISAVHNFPDRQVRGVCMLCNEWIHPAEWVIAAPDPETGKSKTYVRQAHKDYGRVLRIDSMN